MRCLYCHNRDTRDTHGGKEITVEELMKEVVTYRHFMNASGGASPPRAVRRSCRRSLFATGSARVRKKASTLASDTNGFVRRYDPVIDELLEVTDP